MAVIEAERNTPIPGYRYSPSTCGAPRHQLFSRERLCQLGWRTGRQVAAILAFARPFPLVGEFAYPMNMTKLLEKALEAVRRLAEPRRATLVVVSQAFERAGIEFIDENGGGPGVHRCQPHDRYLRVV